MSESARYDNNIQNLKIWEARTEVKRYTVYKTEDLIE